MNSTIVQLSELDVSLPLANSVTMVGVGPVTGPRGPQGDPGVHIGPTPPADHSLLWVDTAGL
jgi:hypothetical protein